jgi:Uma2 family endonuclease
MGMPFSRTEWTADMLNEFPDDGNRYEVIDGELLVTPSPAKVHQRAVGELHFLLLPYAKMVGIDLLLSPSDVRFSERRLVQPDLYASPRLPDGRLPERFADVGVLLLAVEVLSTSTRRTDQFKKRALYQDEKVQDYWIVDTDTRTIEHWTPLATEPEVATHTLQWQPVTAHAPLVIDVVRYFREVFGE